MIKYNSILGSYVNELARDIKTKDVWSADCDITDEYKEYLQQTADLINVKELPETVVPGGPDGNAVCQVECPYCHNSYMEYDEPFCLADEGTDGYKHHCPDCGRVAILGMIYPHPAEDRPTT